MQSTRRISLAINTKGRDTDSEGDLLLHPGDQLSLTYKHDGREGFRHCLRVVGEAGTAWRERCEVEQPSIWYRSLEDALDREIVHNDEVSLHLKGNGEGFERNAWFKVLGWELPKTCASLEFSVWVRTRNLKIAAGGRMGAYLEIYHHKKGRHPEDIYDPPDRTLALEVKPGTRDWTRLSKKLTGLDQIAAIVVRVGGVRFSGEAFFGTPVLLVPGQGNVIRPFDVPAPRHPRRNWLGENLSRKEWPEFAVTVNGRECFRGPVFCCITRDPDAEFSIPESLLKKGPNRIDLELVADYPSAPAYVLRRAEVLQEESRSFEIVAVPEYAAAGTQVPVLLETNNRNVTVSVLGQKMKFDQPGLHVIKIAAESLAQGVSLTDGTRAEEIRIRRVVRKEPDGVLLGTGDAVYVPQTVDAFKRYLKWYLSERVGNFITFRPVYRWCGSRELSPEAWEFAVSLLNKLDMAYALMVDGRELPGKRVCPGNELLEGSGHKGRQSHEADGAFKYWGAYGHEWDFFCEIMQRSSEPDGIFPGVRPTRIGDQFFPFHATNMASDMKSGAEYFVRNVRQLAKTATRHTGPSALFRYMYQAGFKFLGAEQMYCAEDVILAALRGASRAYGKSELGAHLAVQWSSTPLDEPEHFRRYFLSLACCYLQGVTQINTEEGLYRMENLFAREDRFGQACAGHRDVHRQFRQFMETHSRRGTMRTPLGILQGRYCSWTGFLRGPAWDQEHPSMRFGPPEESFDLLKIFYPRCSIDGVYRWPCPHAPQGWYSGTPYGPVDILPIEAPSVVMNKYKVLAFLGWNTYDEREFARLLRFVRSGGTLLLSRPHVSSNVRRCEPAMLPDSATLRELLGPAKKATDRVERRVGKGKVIFYGQDAYPAESIIRSEYEADLRRLAEQMVKDERTRGWIAGTQDVDFAVYDHEHVRTAYLLNITWWRPATAKVTLLLREREFAVNVPFGQIYVLTISKDWAVLPANADVDVTDADDSGFVFQADGESTFTLYHAELSRRVDVVSDQGPVVVRSVGRGVFSFKAPPGRVTVFR